MTFTALLDERYSNTLIQREISLTGEKEIQAGMQMM